MKHFQIVNQETFRNKLYNLDNTDKKIAEKIGVTKSAVSKWHTGVKPQTENIQKILDVYNLTPDELGIRAWDDNKDTEHLRIIIKELLSKNDMTQEQLASVCNLSTSALSKFINKDGNTYIDTLKVIAQYFDVSILYLLGIIQKETPEEEEIYELLNINKKEFIELLKNDNPNSMRLYCGDEYTADEIHEDYYDLKDNIYGSEHLLMTLKTECSRIVEYYTNDNYYEKFEQVGNTMYALYDFFATPTRFNIEDMAHMNIARALCTIFDKYVDEQLSKKGITTDDKTQYVFKHYYDKNIKDDKTSD